MNKKYLYLIPLTLVEVTLQLAFFWLAGTVPCYWVVYVFGTIMTSVHIGLTFIVETTYGTRRSAATIIAGSVCQIILVVTCVGLLVNGSSVRNAVFSLLIVSMVYVVVVNLLILSIEKDDELDTGAINHFYDGDSDYYDELDMNTESLVYKPRSQSSQERRCPTTSYTLDGSNDVLNNGCTPPPLPLRR